MKKTGSQIKLITVLIVCGLLFASILVLGLFLKTQPAPQVPTAGTDFNPSQTSTEDIKPTSEDANVITKVVEHFAAQNDMIGRRDLPTKNHIVVHNESCGPSFFIEDQLNAEMDGKDWSIPQDSIDSLRRRNAKKVSLREVKFGKVIVVADISKLPWDTDDEKLPLEIREGKAFTYFWLPGYSRDGNTAFVRFSLGQTAHGATASCLLVKSDGVWIVKQWRISYYA